MRLVKRIGPADELTPAHEANVGSGNSRGSGSVAAVTPAARATSAHAVVNVWVNGGMAADRMPGCAEGVLRCISYGLYNVRASRCGGVCE